MTGQIFINGVGVVAAFCSMASFIPQAVKIIRERDASSISLGMYVVTAIGFALWSTYGVLLRSWPLIGSNLVSLALSGLILFLKIRYPDGPPGAKASAEHLDETMQAISKLHSDHRRGAEGLQRISERLSRLFSQPRFTALITLAILAWVLANVFAALARFPAFDPWPLQGLQVLTSVTALYMTLFILTAQRREDELGELREQLTLRMSIASEQKIAKVIELLEELRRDLPSVRDRSDANAEALSKPANPDVVLEVLKERQQDLRDSPNLDQD